MDRSPRDLIREQAVAAFLTSRDPELWTSELLGFAAQFGESSEAIEDDIRGRILAMARQLKANGSNGELLDDHAARAAKFRLLSMNDLIREPVPADWLIDGILEDGTLSDVFGPKESLKSFLVLPEGLCISRGMDWFGRRVKAGAVVYACGEAPRGLRRRIKAWTVVHGEKGAFYASQGHERLLNPAGLESVHQACQEVAERHGGLRVLYVDTMARFFSPGDENSTKDMGAFVEALDRLRSELGCAVRVVHHVGHAAGERQRGSSAWGAALDASVRIERPNMLEPRAIASCEKMKDAERFQPFEFRCAPVELPWTDEHGKPSSSLLVETVNEASLANMPGKGLGKWQRQALKVLGGLYADHRRRLERQGRDPCEARVEMDEWRIIANLPRNRWKEAVAALVERQLAHIDQRGVVLTESGEVLSDG